MNPSLTLNFWFIFAIETGINAAEVLLQSSKISPKLKADLEKLIQDGQAVIFDLHTGA